MKNLFKLIVLAILTIFAFNFSYVYATEQESENIVEGIEEVVKPVASDNVSNSDNKSDNKEEVESKSETPSRNTTDGTKNETEETSEVGETKTEDVNTQEPAKTEEPVKSEEPTKDEEEPSSPKAVFVIYNDRTGNDYVKTIEDPSEGHTKGYNLSQLLGSSNTTITDGDDIYTFDGWYYGDTKITSSLSVGNLIVEPYNTTGLRVGSTTGLKGEEKIELHARWTKSSKPNGIATVRVTDVRTGNVTTIEAQALGSQKNKTLASMVSGISNDYKIETATTIYTFKGIYTARDGGSLIDNSFTPGDAFSALKTLKTNSNAATSPSDYRLYVAASDTLTTDTNIDLYILWDEEEKEVPDYTVTVNITDNRTGNTTVVTTKPGTSSSKTLKNMSTGIGDDFRFKDGNKIYTFKGIYDAETGGNKIDASFVPGTLYPELKTLYADSDAETPTDYRLYIASADELTGDKTINLYIQWEEKELHPVKVTFKVIEKSASGTEIHSGNSLPTYSNTINPNGNWTRNSTALTITNFHSGDYSYTVDTWYYEDGTPVPEELYVNGDPTRVKFKYVWSEDDPEEITITYILKWNEKKDNKYDIYVYDEISNGNDHTGNTTGHQGTITHTFTRLVPVDHYQFLYYKMENGDKTFAEGEDYLINVSELGDGVVVREDFYAWWKADITLILIDGNDKLGEKSQFDSITPRDVIGINPTRIGYDFLGWEDETGKLYTLDSIFEANPASTNPEPKVVTLTAKWKQITIPVDVTKIWNDAEDADEIRPDSVTVHISNKSGVVDTVVLSEENGWTHTFVVPMYDGEEIAEYTISEDEVPEYETEISGDIENGFEITNTHLGMGDGGEEYDEDGLPPQTGYDSNYIVQFVLLVFGIMSVYAVRKF